MSQKQAKLIRKVLSNKLGKPFRELQADSAKKPEDVIVGYKMITKDKIPTLSPIIHKIVTKQNFNRFNNYYRKLKDEMKGKPRVFREMLKKKYKLMIQIHES